jgi:hypothetical protein
MAQVDAVAVHRNTFPKKKVTLSFSLRQAPVRANHTMPWEPFVSGGKNVTDQSRRFRVDVAIGADKSNRNRAHAVQDACCARIEPVAFRRHCVTQLGAKQAGGAPGAVRLSLWKEADDGGQQMAARIVQWG